MFQNSFAGLDCGVLAEPRIGRAFAQRIDHVAAAGSAGVEVQRHGHHHYRIVAKRRHLLDESIVRLLFSNVRASSYIEK